MIPKIIHLCWLSEDEYPPMIKECIDSWKRHLPDYEIRLWNTKQFDINSTIWTKQAFECKKYAFVADYIRLYALYNFGGIYLDSDILVYKSFNDLLDLPYFVGQEYSGSFEPAVIGAEKGLEWIKTILDYYSNKNFINIDGCLNITPLPHIFYKRLVGDYSFIQLKKKIEYIYDDKFIYVFDKTFFNSRDSVGIKRYPNSYCSHCYTASWKKLDSDYKSILIKYVPNMFLRIYFFISHHTFRKHAVHSFEPDFLEVIK